MANAKIEMIRAQLEVNKDIGAGQKDAYADMLLDAGTAANGLKDEERPKATAKAIESIGICITRDAMHRIPELRKVMTEVCEEVMTRLLTAHAKSCPLLDAVPQLVNDTMKAEALKEDGTWAGEERRRGGQATVNINGVKTRADPVTTRWVSTCAVLCMALLAYMVNKIW